MSFNPLKSRRFWTMMVDVLISTATYIISMYGTPQFQDAAKFVIVTYQPVAIFLIGAYTVDDTMSNVAAIKEGTHPDYPPVSETVVTTSGGVSTTSTYPPVK
jgi:hypothetical protein